MRTLYLLSGFGLGMAVMFLLICKAHADTSTTMTASITVVDAISTDDYGTCLPIPTDDGGVNF